VKHHSSCDNKQGDKNQAWDFYFLSSNYRNSNGTSAISLLNQNVVTHSDPAAFLIKKCWKWYDGKCDKHHQICPSDILVSYVALASNNCPDGDNQGNLSSLPLAPELCCFNNTCEYSSLSTAQLSRAPGVREGGTTLVAAEGSSGDSSICQAAPLTAADWNADGMQVVFANNRVGPGTVLLRVCFNTSSNCIYIKTNTTQNKFSRFTCKTGGWDGSTKCIYSLGQSNSRCANNNNGLATPSNSIITVIKADDTPLSEEHCNESTTYCYFSGSIAGANGTSVVQCASGSNACGQPQAFGLFGNCSLTIDQLCPNFHELGYAGKGSDLPLTTGSTGNGASTGNSELADFGGLSSPYTYMALTWYDANGECCPKKDNKKWW
jgi:hypothetical protein